MNILEKSVRALPAQGKTFNEEMLGFYKSNGASSSVLPDAEKQYLAKAVVGAYVSNQDGWKELEGRFGVGGFNSIYAVRKNGGSCWPIQDSLGLVYGPEKVSAVNTDGATFEGGILTETAATTGHGLAILTPAIGVAAYSVRAKAASRNFLWLYFANYAGGSAVFNLVTGTVANIESCVSATIASSGDGYYTCTLYKTTTSASIGIGCYASSSGAPGGYAGNGSAALYIDPASISVREVISASLYQDTAGTLPVTTQGQVIGLSLDQSYGSANLGSELVANGSFASATGWTLPAGWSVSSGVASFNSASAASASQSISFTGGKSYIVSGTITAFSSGSFYPHIGGVNAGAVSAAGAFQKIIVAGSNNSLFEMYCSAGSNLSVDNISVKEVLGTHLTQSTGANKPTLTKLAYGKLPYAYSFDGSNDTLTFTPPAITTAATLGWAGTLGNLQANGALIGGTGGVVGLEVTNTGQLNLTKSFVAYIGQVGGVMASNTSYVITATVTALGTWALRVNGVQVGTGINYHAAFNVGNLYLMSQGSGGFVAGACIEPMVTNTIMPLADLKAWERYACNQLGITYAG